jgi:hypothetical protein
MVEEKKPLVGADDVKEERPFKGKGRSFKGKRNFRGARGAKGVPTRGGNDFEFWNQYPELMNIATRFPWMHIAGTRLSGQGVSVALPNVAVQHYFSVPSKSGAATDPLNLAFRQIYLDMHRKYRGIGAYQASDIAIAMICIESTLQLLVECERVYGILKGYPIKSRIEPEGLLRAMGYTQAFIDSVKSGMADYRYGINRLITLAKRLPLPSGMNFFRNHVALNAFTYKDSQDERAGILVFVFDNYYRWQTTNDTSCINKASTALSVLFDRTTFTTYSELLSLIETELNRLLTDSDVLRITSDFISCYGENNMQVLMDLPEDYSVVAQYSESILHKWHNSERAGSGQIDGECIISYVAVGSATTKLANGDFAVYQRDDVVMSLPVLASDRQPKWIDVGNDQYVYATDVDVPLGEADITMGHIADSWEAEPSQEHICEAMLWRVCVYPRRDSSSNIVADEFQYIGTEILTKLQVYSVVNSTIAAVSNLESTLTSHCTGDVAALSHFDWHPYQFMMNGSPTVIQDIFGDTDNVTVISTDVIAKVVDAAALSAFKINISGSGNSRE